MSPVASTRDGTCGVMAGRIAPSVFGRLALRFLAGGFLEKKVRRLLYWLVFRAPREAPPVPLDRFPAHYHCNVLPSSHGRRCYSALVVAFLDHAQAAGAIGVHGRSEDPENGPWRRLARSYGRSDLLGHEAERQSSFYRIVLGEEETMLNRVWGATLTDYRDWVIWLGRKMRI